MPVTITPAIKGKLVIRFEDGTEAELGEVTYRPDVSVTLNADFVEYRARQ